MSAALSYSEAKKVAEDQDALVIYTAPNLLLLDLDSQHARNLYELRRGDVHHYHSIEEVDEWTSKSGPGHWHIRIRLSNELPFEERIVLQALLGSDPKREMLSMVRRRLEPTREERTLSMLFKPRVV